MELNRDAFLALGWSESMRPRIEAALSLEGVVAISAHRDGRKITAKRWDQIPDDWGPDAVAYCLAHERPRTDAGGRLRTLEDVGIDKPAKKDGPSRTAQALALVDQGVSMTEAAKQVGITIAAVSNAVKRRETLPRCPHCGQTIRPTYKPKP